MSITMFPLKKKMDKFRKTLDLIDFIGNPFRDIEIFGMFGPGNLGDEAMLVAALNSLPTKRCVPWRSHPNHPILNALVQKRIRKHLLVGGGTLIHGGNTGWLDYVEMRSRQGVKVSFFGTGIAFTEDQMVNSFEPYRRWGKVLANSDEIHLRGPHSVEICQRFTSDASTFGDFAFLLHRQDFSVKCHGNRAETIGINIGNCLGCQELFENAFVSIIRRLSADHFLAFHVVVSSDMEATQRVINRAGLLDKSYRIEQHYFDPNYFMYSIRNYRAFIGLKLHAAGLAMVAGVPALMFAYLPKAFDFLAPLGLQDHMLELLPINIDSINSKIEQLLSRPDHFVVEDKIQIIAASQRRELERVYLLSST